MWKGDVDDVPRTARGDRFGIPQWTGSADTIQMIAQGDKSGILGSASSSPMAPHSDQFGIRDLQIRFL